MTFNPVDLFQHCYRAALKAVDGKRVVQDYLQHSRMDGPVRVIALGKAAQSMMLGAVEVLGPQLQQSLLITGREYWDEQQPLDSRVQCHFGEHPVPGKNSLHAGELLTDFVARPGDDQLLFLISGGSSSLVEHLVPGADLSLLAELNRYLLGAGLDIGQMNGARQGLSMIKNGRLRSYLSNPNYLALYISDVPGDDLRVIGSGPLAGDGACSLEQLKLNDTWKSRLQSFQQALPGQVVDRGKHVLLASLGSAMRAVQHYAEKEGVVTHLHSEFLDGDVEDVAKQLVAEVGGLQSGLHIWGGEPQVTLPDRSGRGGRNQQLVLLAARELAGQSGCWLFSAATDGRDGNSDTAAAWCDGDSWQRAELLGLAPQAALAEANAEPCLRALAATLAASPSGSNVMDLLLIYKGP